MKKFSIGLFVFGLACIACGYCLSSFDNFKSELLIENLLFNSGLNVVLLSFGYVSLVVGVIFMIFKKLTDNCTLSSLGLATATSLFAGMGLYCLLIILLEAGFSDRSEHPVSSLVCGIGGIISIIAVIALFFVYFFIYREKYPSRKGVVVDLIFGILYIIPFFLASAVFYDIVEMVVRYFIPNF